MWATKGDVLGPCTGLSSGGFGARLSHGVSSLCPLPALLPCADSALRITSQPRWHVLLLLACANLKL